MTSANDAKFMPRSSVRHIRLPQFTQPISTVSCIYRQEGALPEPAAAPISRVDSLHDEFAGFGRTTFQRAGQFIVQQLERMIELVLVTVVQFALGRQQAEALDDFCILERVTALDGALVGIDPGLPLGFGFSAPVLELVQKLAGFVGGDQVSDILGYGLGQRDQREVFALEIDLRVGCGGLAGKTAFTDGFYFSYAMLRVVDMASGFDFGNGMPPCIALKTR